VREEVGCLCGAGAGAGACKVVTAADETGLCGARVVLAEGWVGVAGSFGGLVCLISYVFWFPEDGRALIMTKRAPES
jgi:hypothetical protein